MESNIYDVVISELILKNASGGAGGAGGAGGSNYTPYVLVTSSLTSNSVQENFSGLVTFSSTVYNIPSGYTVKANTHSMTYTSGGAATNGSSNVISSSQITVIVGSAGSTFLASSTVTLAKFAEPDIVLTNVFTITAVVPMYYGIKPFNATPDFTGLTPAAGNNTVLTFTSSTLGRLHIVLPVSALPIVSVIDPSGNIIPASAFTSPIGGGSLKYYLMNWDIILTGSNLKYFTIKFS